MRKGEADATEKEMEKNRKACGEALVFKRGTVSPELDPEAELMTSSLASYSDIFFLP